MEEREFSIKYSVGENLNEISDDFQELIAVTKAFSKNAYAPYSKFHVSACLKLKSGKIVKGANMENASYPVSICAERTLLSHTVSNYPDEIIETIAIYVDKAVGSPVPPCGLCRQTLLEVEERQKHPIRIILLSKEGGYIIIDKSSDLLPLYFDGKML